MKRAKRTSKSSKTRKPASALVTTSKPPKSPEQVVQAWLKKELAAEKSGKGLKTFRRRIAIEGLPRLALEYQLWNSKDKFAVNDGGEASSAHKTISVTFVPPMRGVIMPPLEPSIEQVRAFHYVKSHFAQLLKQAERAVKKLEPMIAACEDDELGDGRKRTRSRSIQPESIWVFDVAKSGVAYVSIGFHCSWDTEHGFDLGLHKSRIISVDYDSLRRDALRDGGKEITVKPQIRKS